MRLVTKAEFLTLPAGTLYAPLEQPWVFGDMRVKGDNAGPDDLRPVLSPPTARLSVVNKE